MQQLSPELAARFRRVMADPILFWKVLLPGEPHDGQQRWLRESSREINVLVPANRWGKSTVIAAKHIYKCMTKQGVRIQPGHTWLSQPYETISAAHSADQAEIVFRKAQQMLSFPAIAPFVSRVYSTPFPRIEFYNGAVFHCRSAHDGGKYIDGHEYRFVSIDEAGYIQQLKMLMTNVILMRLAGGGEVDLIGTPKGLNDLYWYASRAMRGVEGYHLQRGSIFDNPFLPADDIKKRDALLAQASEKVRRQVIYGDFVSLEGLAFTQDELDQAFDPHLPAHRDYREGRRYIQAWDLGRQTDWTVGVTFDVTEPPFELVDYQRLNRVPWESIYNLIAKKKAEYKVYQPLIDASGPSGDVIEEELTKRGIFIDPVKMSSRTQKVDLINTLQSAFDYGRKQTGTETVMDEAGLPREEPVHDDVGGKWGLIRMPSISQLVDEFGVYQIDDKDLTQDSVMAVAMAVQAVYDGTLLHDPVVGGIY